jgi:hypothetical protein
VAAVYVNVSGFLVRAQLICRHKSPPPGTARRWGV